MDLKKQLIANQKGSVSGRLCKAVKAARSTPTALAARRMTGRLPPFTAAVRSRMPQHLQQKNFKQHLIRCSIVIFYHSRPRTVQQGGVQRWQAHVPHAARSVHLRAQGDLKRHSPRHKVRLREEAQRNAARGGAADTRGNAETACQRSYCNLQSSSAAILSASWQQASMPFRLYWQ